MYRKRRSRRTSTTRKDHADWFLDLFEKNSEVLLLPMAQLIAFRIKVLHRSSQDGLGAVH